jgi:hypothetical protein
VPAVIKYFYDQRKDQQCHDSSTPISVSLAVDFFLLGHFIMDIGFTNLRNEQEKVHAPAIV